MDAIKTIIFDMDGVIIDSEPIHMKIEQGIFSELGLNITEKEHQTYVGASSLELWTAIIEKNDLDISANELSQKKQQRYLRYLKTVDNLSPLDGVKESIDHFYRAEKKMVLASSAGREEIEWVLTRFRLKSYFPIIISGAELKRSKPDPAIFIKAAEMAQTPAHHCCVIEDSRNGVEAAKAAGMKCIGFRNPNSGNQDLSKSDLLLDDFKNVNFDKIMNDLAS